MNYKGPCSKYCWAINCFLTSDVWDKNNVQDTIIIKKIKDTGVEEWIEVERKDFLW